MTPNPLLLQTEQRHTTLLKSTLLAKVLFMHPPSKKLCRRSYANRSSASKRSADNSNARNTLLTKGTANERHCTSDAFYESVAPSIDGCC